MTTYRYRAFISYSHRDEQAATKLHRALERYRPPRTLGERRLSPIFRDRDELPASAHLGEEVRKSLSESEFLIVICSASAAKSRWVNEEIEFFRSLGRDDNILAFIAADEPPACFPKALIEDKETGEELEPIAADSRTGGDGFSAAMLKIAAGMLGVGFDALRQREYRRQVRRLTAIAAGSVAMTALTTGLAVAAYLAQQDAERRQEQSEDLISFMVGDLRQQLQPIGRLSILESVGDKAIDYFGTLTRGDETPEVMLRRGQTMHQLGSVYLDLGQWPRAIDAFRQSLTQVSALHKQFPDDTRFLFELSQAEFWLGNAYMIPCRDTCPPDHADYDRVAEHWQAYLDHSLALNLTDPTNLDWALETAWAHNNLGALNRARKRFDAATAAYLQGAERFEQIVATDPDNPDFRNELANVYMGLWRCYRELGDVRAARTYAGKGVDTAVVDDANARAVYEAALWHGYLASSMFEVGEVEPAIATWQQALTDIEAVSALDEDNTVWHYGVAFVAINLAEALVSVHRDPTDTIARGQVALSKLLAMPTPFRDWTDAALRYDVLNAARGASGIALPVRAEDESPSATVARANRLLMQGTDIDLPSLVVDLEAALASSRATPVQLALARVLDRAQRPAEARAVVRNLVEHGNRHPDVVRLANAFGIELPAN